MQQLIAPEAPTVRVRLWTLGPFLAEVRPASAPNAEASPGWQAVTAGQWEQYHRGRSLLLRLLCAPRRRLERIALQEDLWPPRAGQGAERSLWNAAHEVRKLLGQESLLTVGSSYQLAGQARLWVDAEAATTLLLEAERRSPAAAPALLPLLEEAEGYFRRGPFLEGLSGSWVWGRRLRLTRRRQRCGLWLATLYEQLGWLERVEEQCGRLLDEAEQEGESLPEGAILVLIRALLEAGLREQARRCYEEARRRRQEQDDPLPQETQTTIERLLREQHGAKGGRFTLITEVEQTGRSLDHQVGSALLPPPAVRCDGGEQQGLPQPPDVVQYETRMPTFQERFSPPVISPTAPPAEPDRFSAPVPLAPDARVAMAEMTGMGESGTLDCAAWYSLRMARLVALVLQGRWRAPADLEYLLNREVAMLDQGRQLFEPEAVALSRRSALLLLAALPSGLLGLLHRPLQPSFIEAEVLPACTASLTACWYLLAGHDFATVEQTVGGYLPLLQQWARQPSSLQPAAASLATQGYLLLDIIAHHRLQFRRRQRYCHEAVALSRLAGDPPLLVKALTQLGDACYHLGDNHQMLQVLEEAYSLRESVPPVQRYSIFTKLALAYAQRGQARMDYFSQARDIFSENRDSSALPAYLAADEGFWRLILWEGLVWLELSKHDQQPEHFREAERALAQIERLPETVLVPERARLEILNGRAQAAIGSGEREAFAVYSLQVAQGLQHLPSQKRRQELLVNLKRAVTVWPRDARISDLFDLLL
jgi:DNA-binding SARP family transcriptional activator